MPIRPFKQLPKDLVEWGKFFQQTAVTPSAGSVGNDEIANGSVTFEKFQSITPNRLLGRDTSPAGQVQELDVGGGLEFTGTGIRRSALTGKVTADAGSDTTAIPVSATDRLLGRQSVGAGNVEEITCTAAGRALLDDVDAAAQRTTLGLGTAATRNTGNSGANVPLLNGANVHASGQFTAFAVNKTPVNQQAANADTSGATLGDLETEVNEIKAVLRAFGLIAT